MKKIQPPAECLHIVYCSRLSPGTDYTVYADVCRVSRRRHLSDRVSGMLLFDGQRFCQWLQGEPGATELLMSRIAQDARHTAVTIRLHSPMPICAFTQGWRAGFVGSDALDRFLKFDGSSPDQVLTAFGGLLAVADL